jgi:hypothetical protein
MSKAREYLAKAKQHEKRAKQVRDAENREWHSGLARIYRMLAETEGEAVRQRLKMAA